MTSKQRALQALRREAQPDRPPLQFDLSLQQLERFSAVHNLPLELSPSYYEDLTYRISANKLRTRMGSDCIVVGAGLGEAFTFDRLSDGSYRNEFQMLMRQGPLYVDTIGHPLADVSSAAEVQNFVFPDPGDPWRYRHAERDITELGSEYFIIGDCEVTIFALARQLMGMEHCLISLVEENDYLDLLFHKCYQWSLGVATELVARGVEAIWFGDDFGTQQSLIMSPDTWRKRLKPLYASLFSALKRKNPDLLIIFHSDGAVAPLLPDFIELGVDVFNPVEPGVPGHEPDVLKRRFGDRLSFFGAIDQQDLLPNGSPEEIRRDVRNKIGALGAGGGYMVAPAHIIQADTPRENTEALINAVLDYQR